MVNDISKVCANMQQVAIDAAAEFGGMTPAQLNWKPSVQQWSIAQCFDHLMVTHSLYFPEFDRLADVGSSMTFWERYSPLSGFFGRFLIKGLDPKNTKKMKTTGKAMPSSSQIGGDIIERFVAHQDVIGGYLRRIAEKVDANKQIVTSPLLGFVTYSLADAFVFYLCTVVGILIRQNV